MTEGSCRAIRSLRQTEIARKQLVLLRLLQLRALAHLESAADWQGRQTLRAFARARESEFRSYMDARARAKAAGATIFG